MNGLLSLPAVFKKFSQPSLLNSHTNLSPVLGNTHTIICSVCTTPTPFSSQTSSISTEPNSTPIYAKPNSSSKMDLANCSLSHKAHPSLSPHASMQPFPPLLPPSKQKQEEDGLFKDPATFSHLAKEETWGIFLLSPSKAKKGDNCSGKLIQEEKMCCSFYHQNKGNLLRYWA